MNILDHKHDFDKIIDFLKSDIAGLRTGRASAVIVENVFVEAYGSRQSLKAVASITIPDPKTINIEPWDKSILAAVEKGIRDSGTGLNPTNDGRLIRLFLPELTSERRQELIKVLHQKLENAHISVRKTREEVKELISMAEESDEIREDEKFKLQEDLEKMVKEYNDKIKMIGDEKEKEINTV
ncbi:MAG: Ribosome-recycling factor [Candidatus Magasanikbacteria bacterium GW2011_GWA2_46_17]|uniref:Ribosome-recycling factor n=1 Tax=Candidatus Magasanikbacteria bacterium GW2011_GWA2_46_17 TaxID=1619042 RepID=A0A0G1RYP1_9BACT|nr:MAG: Ribosome-recycling factor [Candidatus Magasanikbacteria bacterium GW2011_GWA2_46_17]